MPSLAAEPQTAGLVLDYLHSLSDGNIDFEIEMMELFLLRVPQDIEALQLAFDEMAYTRISEISHKLKSSMAIFSRTDLEKSLSIFVEQSNKHQIDEDLLHTFALLKMELSEFYPLLQAALSQLKLRKINQTTDNQ